MNCRSCGAANPPDAPACRVCGRPPAADPAQALRQPGEPVPPPPVLRPPAERPKPAGPQTSTLAIVSLAAGVISWLFAPILATVVAVVCGHLALREIDSSGGALEGRGLALTGLVLGYVQIALAALVLLGLCVFFAVSFLLIQSAAVAS